MSPGRTLEYGGAPCWESIWYVDESLRWNRSMCWEKSTEERSDY